MNERSRFLETLLRSTQSSDGIADAPIARGESGSCAPRRRLLRSLALGGIGLVALRSSGLASALVQGPGDIPPEVKKCTSSSSTTVSQSGTNNVPSAGSYTYSMTFTISPDCNGGQGTTTLPPGSGTQSSSACSHSTGPTLSISSCHTMSGNATSPTQPQSMTMSCDGSGVASATITVPRHASYVSSYTDSAAVSETYTVECPQYDTGQYVFGGSNTVEAALPPTLDAVSSRLREFVLDFGRKR